MRNSSHLTLLGPLCKQEGSFNEVFPGVWGNRTIRPFISGEQGNKSLKLKGTGE